MFPLPSPSPPHHSLPLPGLKVDLAACRAYRPQMLTWEQWLVKVGYDKMKIEAPSMCIIS